MINKDGGGGGGQFLDFMGGNTAVMRVDKELMEGPTSPPNRENPARSKQICDIWSFYTYLKP